MGCLSHTSLVGCLHDLIVLFSGIFPVLLSLSIMQRVHSFHGFAMKRLDREPLSVEEIVDTCLQAMQEGVLDVCAQNTNGQYVWICYGMTANQCQHTCSLLQRAGVVSSILWDPKWFVDQWFVDHLRFMADIEYLWTDLKAVHMYLEYRAGKPVWVVQELGRRQTWNAGLRRAWLAACLM